MAAPLNAAMHTEEGEGNGSLIRTLSSISVPESGTSTRIHAVPNKQILPPPSMGGVDSVQVLYYREKEPMPSILFSLFLLSNHLY